MFLTNIFGNAAGPIVYGFLSDKFKATDPTMAWKLTMCYYGLGFISAILASIFNYRFMKRRDAKKAEEANKAKEQEMQPKPEEKKEEPKPAAKNEPAEDEP